MADIRWTWDERIEGVATTPAPSLGTTTGPQGTVRGANFVPAAPAALPKVDRSAR
jgi:hypothetical protein